MPKLSDRLDDLKLLGEEIDGEALTADSQARIDAAYRELEDAINTAESEPEDDEEEEQGDEGEED